MQRFQNIFSAIIAYISHLFAPKPGKAVFPSARVVRPDDMLVLTFEFVNLPLQKTGEGEERQAVLLPGKESFIIVKFQAQNIAEQAFFEATQDMNYKSAGQKASPPDDPDQATSGSDEPLANLPVGSRLAQPSRLVFKVPDGEKPIPYNLESLLDVIAKYELSVAATALPPVPKPRLKLSRHIFERRYPDLIAAQTFKLAQPQEESRSPASALQLSPAQTAIQLANVQSWQAKSETSGYLLTASDAAMSEAIAAILQEMVTPKLRPPSNTETSIEAPFRLILSPNRYAAFVHANRPESSAAGVLELWHTRLAVRKDAQVSEADDPLRTVRAIWSRDPDFKPDDWGHGPKHHHAPFRMSLDSTDRHNLVHLTANYRIKVKKPVAMTYKPEPVEVNRMMLSTLGAWLNVFGLWDPPKDTTSPASSLSVQEWRHRATLGRDHYVRVVYKGYLLPFCHPASLVKITERKFHPNTNGNIAYLRQRMFIVVQKPLQQFIQTGVTDSSGRSYDLGMPFTMVRLTTLVTPNLEDPAAVPPNQGQDMFWPRVNGNYFKFHVVAEDIESRKVEFDAPLMFVSSEGGLAYDLAKMNNIHTVFDASAAHLRTYPLNGQMVAYAAQSTPGSTAFETVSMTFSFHVPDGEGDLTDPGDRYGNLMRALANTDLIRAHPRLFKANLVVPAVKHLVGQAGVMEVGFPETYLQKGFTSANNGELFLELLGGATQNMSFDGMGDRAGALVQPNMQIKGLTRLSGPVAGDLNEIAKGQFNPEKFFAGLNAYIFGCIPLGKIILALDPGGILSHPERMPKFITEQVMGVTAFLNDLDRLKESIQHPNIQSALNPSLAGNLAQDYTNLTADLQTFLANPLDVSTFKTNFQTHLGVFKTHLDNLKNALPALPTSAPQDVLLRLISLVDQIKKATAVLDFVDRLVNSLKLPSEVKVRFEWKPELVSWENIFINQNLKTGKPAELLIAVEMQAMSNYQPDPAFLVICRLANFTIDLIGNLESFIRIHFTKIEFFASSSKKPDINVVLDEIEFVGVLSFVQTLKELIPLDGFSDPPAIEVTSEGIKAGFSLALPNLAVGMFSLQNLSLGAGFSIPFVGKPLSVRFNFCERHEPFTLTVCLFGGGGFFAVTVDPHGVQILEASFEFGASLAIDFGVASGGVTVMAGIYYRMESGNSSLTGYFRLHGEVDVLGIISASIELYLELRYEFSSGKCVGKAVLTIEVEVFMFSISVSIECERKFAGSAGDPTFAEMMEAYLDPISGLTVNPWNEYCGAFA